MHYPSSAGKLFSYSYIKNFRPDKTNYAYGFNTEIAGRLEDLASGICTSVWGASVWSNGHRRQDNFLFSDIVALDFESPEFSLEQAKKEFCDMRHIIGTTRSHQKAKGSTPPIDRFRVILFWQEQIKDIRTFRYNMQVFADKYPLDESALDGARYFFPCNMIVSIEPDGDLVDVRKCPEDFEPAVSPEEYKQLIQAKMRRFELTKRFDKHIEDFLYRGKPFWSGRQASCYSAAIAMFESGLKRDEVIGMLNKAPFDRKEFDIEKDLMHAVVRAEKFILRSIHGPGNRIPGRSNRIRRN